MPIYQALLNGSGLRHDIDGTIAVGFFAYCRAKSPTKQDACELMVEALSGHPSVVALMEKNPDLSIEIEEVVQLGRMRALFSRCPAGLVFYDEE